MSSDNQFCFKCGEPITEQHFSTGNFEIGAQHGIKHKNCSLTQQFFPFWSQQYVSNESQYSHQSSGSCTINALETALRLQSGSKPSVSLINDILIMASLYTSSMHTGVGDILPHVTRYNTILNTIDWTQCSVKNIRQIITKLDKCVSDSNHDVSCVITKPPESIFLHKTYHKNKRQQQYILYDSHPRHEKGLNGSHMLIFEDLQLLNDYLMVLFPFIDLGSGYGLYGDMMNQCEATYLQIDHNKIKHMDIMKIDHQQMSKDLSQIGFQLQRQYDNSNHGSSSNLFDKFKNKAKNNKLVKKIMNKKDNNEYKGKEHDISIGKKKNNNKNRMEKDAKRKDENTNELKEDTNKNIKVTEMGKKMKVDAKENKNEFDGKQDTIVKANANNNKRLIDDTNDIVTETNENKKDGMEVENDEISQEDTNTGIESIDTVNREQTDEFIEVNKSEILPDNEVQRTIKEIDDKTVQGKRSDINIENDDEFKGDDIDIVMKHNNQNEDVVDNIMRKIIRNVINDNGSRNKDDVKVNKTDALNAETSSEFKGQNDNNRMENDNKNKTEMDVENNELLQDNTKENNKEISNDNSSEDLNGGQMDSFDIINKFENQNKAEIVMEKDDKIMVDINVTKANTIHTEIDNSFNMIMKPDVLVVDNGDSNDIDIANTNLSEEYVNVKVDETNNSNSSIKYSDDNNGSLKR